MKQNRFKSWALWLGVAALAAWIVSTFWHLDISTEIQTFMDLLCPILVLLGLINNPTDKKHI